MSYSWSQLIPPLKHLSNLQYSRKYFLQCGPHTQSIQIYPMGFLEKRLNPADPQMDCGNPVSNLHPPPHPPPLAHPPAEPRASLDTSNYNGSRSNGSSSSTSSSGSAWH
jgi:hypothetical protein